MHLLHESHVLPTEIDSLGHMNVRHYLERLDAAGDALLRSLGLDPSELRIPGREIRRSDTYIRYRREQFEGAPLHARGGILDVNESGVRNYVELCNAETREIAACFVAVMQHIDTTEQHPLPMPRVDPIDIDRLRVAVPDHGLPRTLSLEPIRTDTGLDELSGLISQADDSTPMTGRRNLRIRADEVDDHGWLRGEIDVLFLAFMRQVEEGERNAGPPVFEADSGQRVGQAVMETRSARFRQPRLGESVVTFGADVGLTAKARQTRRWAFTESTGTLLSISDTVSVLIDLDERRAIEMPADMRALLTQHYLPDLL